MSESMRRKNPARYALLEEARKLGIVGRHKMSSDTLRATVAARRAAQRDVALLNGADAPDTSTDAGRFGIAAIREARKERVTDDFELGTVIRWKSDAGYNVFLYVAIKTAVGWATSASATNPFVSQVLDFDELLEVLGRAETVDVAVASDWQPVA